MRAMLLHRAMAALPALLLVHCSLLLDSGLSSEDEESGANEGGAETGAATDSETDAWTAAGGDATGKGDASDEDGDASGSMAPTRLFELPATTTAIAVDATHFYWAAASTLSRRALASGSPDTIGPSDGPIATIALGTNYVVWGDTTEKYRMVAKNAFGTSMPETYTATGSRGLVTIDRDDNVAYATDYGDVTGRRPGTTVTFLIARRARVAAAKADGATLYFFGSAPSGSELNLWWCPNSDCLDTANPRGPLATGQEAPRLFAAGGGRFAWIDSTNTLRAATVATPQPTTVATVPASTVGLAVTANAIYFTADDTVWKVAPSASSTPVALALAQGAPTAIVANGTHVYWFSTGTRDVWRLPL